MKPGLLGWLARTPVLIGFFAATVLIGAGFYFVIQAVGGDLLDMIANGNDAIIRLTELNSSQKQAHFLGTVFLDTLYPIAYGGFLIGMLSRLAWNWRWAVILVPIITAFCDLAENAVQAMALNGHASEILLVKDIVTPVKFAGLGVSLVLVLLLATGALIRRLRG